MTLWIDVDLVVSELNLGVILFYLVFLLKILCFLSLILGIVHLLHLLPAFFILVIVFMLSTILCFFLFLMTLISGILFLLFLIWNAFFIVTFLLFPGRLLSLPGVLWLSYLPIVFYELFIIVFSLDTWLLEFLSLLNCSYSLLVSLNVLNLVLAILHQESLIN